VNARARHGFAGAPPRSRAVCGEDWKIDWVVGVAGDAAQIVEGAVAAGFARTRAKFFATPQEAAEFLAGFIEAGDLLLVKGSRA